MATKATLRNRAANDLGLLRLGQSLQSQDVTRIEEAYDEVFAQLKSEGLTIWASDGSTPDELTPHVAAMMADNCLNTYGVSTERYNRIKLASAQGIREIRRFVQPRHESTEPAQDF